jgi:anti-sigma regulatory factor (Ser/Thr protein kinase)
MASETPISNSIVVESIPTAIVEVCRQILPKLEENSFSSEDIFSIHLALEEAFINAVMHGNKMDSSKG